MVKQTVVHSYYRILHSNKTGENTDTCNNLHEFLKNYAEETDSKNSQVTYCRFHSCNILEMMKLYK